MTGKPQKSFLSRGGLLRYGRRVASLVADIPPYFPRPTMRFVSALLIASCCIPWSTCQINALQAEEPTAQPVDAGTPIALAIDSYIGRRLTAEGITPSRLVTDATLLRRTTLDLIGRPPTSGELDAFLSGDSRDKRLQLVERLIASDEFVRHQANEFDAWLMPGGGSLRTYLQTSELSARGWTLCLFFKVGSDFRAAQCQIGFMPRSRSMWYRALLHGQYRRAQSANSWKVCRRYLGQACRR